MLHEDDNDKDVDDEDGISGLNRTPAGGVVWCGLMLLNQTKSAQLGSA